MTNAPDRIWLLPDSVEGFDADGAVWGVEGPCANDVEYVRADLARARLEAAEAMHELMCHLWCEMKLPPDLEDKMDMVFSAWDAAQKGGDT